MYNAEKFLPVCLESILNQTFTDFELLVVDDCSTDSSYAIAESYLERFGGRLKIVSLPENTGGCAVPRNVGLDLSQGKYVYFIDADDFIVYNALETLYNFAEDYRAEVVYMDCGFTCDTEPVPTKINFNTWYSNDIFEEPTFETTDLAERVGKFIKFAFHFQAWVKFVRRDLIIDNDIKFLPARVSEDVIWTFKLLCLAKNFLHIPTPLYIYRTNDESVMHRKRTPEEKLNFFTSPLLCGVEMLENFMNQIDFFVKNPRIRLHVLHYFVTIHFNFMEESFKALSFPEAWEIFLHEFSSTGNPNSALISYLITVNNIYRNRLNNDTE